MKRFLNLLSVISILFSCVNADAESAAFGFFINESKNESFDYLEKILPNSFAGTLKNKYNFDVIKPGQISAFANDGTNGIKKEIIRDEDLSVLTKNISADYFVYGSFKPLENNRIRLNINVYKIGTKSVFQFEETGYLETEIFKLVDKIAIQIKNVANESLRYKNDTIKAKSKLSIITNLEGDELNSVYFEFLNNGFKISPTQGNDLYSLIDYEQIKKFYHLSGVNASYHMIDRRKDVELLIGTWSGTAYYKKKIEEKNAYENYSFNYLKTKIEILKKIKSFNSDQADYIMIIGFDEDKSNAWIRCLNLKDNKLLITESGITGSSINEITKNIITIITTGLPVNN